MTNSHRPRRHRASRPPGGARRAAAAAAIAAAAVTIGCVRAPRLVTHDTDQYRVGVGRYCARFSGFGAADHPAHVTDRDAVGAIDRFNRATDSSYPHALAPAIVRGFAQAGPNEVVCIRTVESSRYDIHSVYRPLALQVKHGSMVLWAPTKATQYYCPPEDDCVASTLHEYSDWVHLDRFSLPYSPKKARRPAPAPTQAQSSESCRLSSDCARAEQCVHDRCVLECREDRDCAVGSTCRLDARGVARCLPAGHAGKVAIAQHPSQAERDEAKRYRDRGMEQLRLARRLADADPTGEETRAAFHRAARDHARACRLGQLASCHDWAALLGRAGIHDNTARRRMLNAVACRGGVPAACRDLALMYGRGDGVAKNPKKRIQLLDRACGAGDGLACYLLYQAYEGGVSVPKQPQRADNYLKRACAHGVPASECKEH